MFINSENNILERSKILKYAVYGFKFQILKYMIDKEQVKDISIVDFLALNGFRPTKVVAGRYWYRSPFRLEEHPSFCVNRKNQWADFSEERKKTNKGSAIWHDVIDLAMRIYNTDFCEAVNMLGSLKGISVFVPSENIYETDNKIEVVKEREITYRKLIEYLKVRNISLSVANKYCKQIFYKIKGRENVFFAIGFKSDNGRWALRNQDFKVCTGQDITTIKVSDSSSYAVFEGFFDFLSFVEECGKPKVNCIILNSVTNIGRAYDTFSAATRVYVMLDNDNKGREVTSDLQAKFGAKIVDKSEHYSPYKDYNEYWVEKGGRHD